MTTQTTSQRSSARFITDSQIRALSDAASEHGDLLQAAICDRALDVLDETSRIGDDEAVRQALGLTVEAARRECARAADGGRA